MSFDETELIFDTRKQEIEHFYKYLKTVEEQSISKNELSDKLPVLKSAILLMLYNIIESVVTTCLTEFNKVIIEFVNSLSKKNKYLVMSDSIRKIWADNYMKNLSKDHDCVEIFDSLFKVSLKDNDLGNLRTVTAGGDLDARKIRELFKERGVSIIIDDSCQQERLLFIKNKRNQLAHGGESFHQASRDLSVDDIESYCIATFSFIKCMIVSVQHFCEQNQFLNKSNSLNEYPYL